MFSFISYSPFSSTIEQRLCLPDSLGLSLVHTAFPWFVFQNSLKLLWPLFCPGFCQSVYLASNNDENYDIGEVLPLSP